MQMMFGLSNLKYECSVVGCENKSVCHVTQSKKAGHYCADHTQPFIEQLRKTKQDTHPIKGESNDL